MHRERRKYHGNTVLFDYRDLVDKKNQKGKKLLKMKKGPMTYESDKGTRFFNDHPFQWVEVDEADHLLGFKEEGYVYFVVAAIEDVEDYYCD